MVSAYAVPDVTVPPVMAMPVEVTVPVVWVWFGMAMAKPFQLSVPAPVFWTMALPVTERPLYVYVDAPVLVTAGRVTAAPVTDSPVAVTLVERFRFRPVSVPARVTAEGAAPWMMVPEVVVDSTSRFAPAVAVPTPTSPLLSIVIAFVLAEFPTLKLIAEFVPVLPEVAELPSNVRVPLAAAAPMSSGSVTWVAKVGEFLRAKIVPPPVVVYDVPQADPVEFGMPEPG